MTTRMFNEHAYDCIIDGSYECELLSKNADDLPIFLQFADFSFVTFKELRLSETILVAANFSNAIFYKCTFKCCDFRASNFTGANFYNCTFLDCDLSACNLSLCNLYQTNFVNSSTVGSNWQASMVS